jgi:hypothetical protein
LPGQVELVVQLLAQVALEGHVAHQIQSAREGVDGIGAIVGV